MRRLEFLLLDPNITDEVFTPVKSIVRGRPGLKKYGYLADLVSDENNNISYVLSLTKSGVLPSRFFDCLPLFFQKILCLVEIKLWAFLNHIKLVRRSEFDGASVVVFLRNVNEDARLYISNLRRSGVTIYWHLAHYHLCLDKMSYIEGGDVVLSDYYIPDMVNKNIICPPSVQERFHSKNAYDNRESKIVCFGTIHQYKRMSAGFCLHKGFYTLHPSRLDIYLNDSCRLNEIVVKNFSVIKDDESLYSQQKDYMKIDLVDEYNKYKYAFIGSECTGVLALGTFEAMSCGCEVFIEADMGSRAGLVDNVTAWFFDGTAEGLLARFSEIIESGRRLDSNEISIVLKSRKPESIVASIEKS